MAVQGVSIALATEDVARSVKFCVEQLGFTCTLQLEGFARVRLGAANIMRAAQCPSALARPALYRLDLFGVDNVDDLWESSKTRARIVYPDRDYGVRRARDRGLQTDNGYQLSFAQHVAAN